MYSGGVIHHLMLTARIYFVCRWFYACARVCVRFYILVLLIFGQGYSELQNSSI